MNLREYLRLFGERWKLVVASTLVGLAVAATVTQLTAKVYQADAQIFITSNSTADPLALSQAALYTQTQVATFADIVASPEVLRAVQKDLHLGTPLSDLKSKITATAPAQRSLIDISVSDSTAQDAAALANSVARAFVTQLKKYTTPTDSTKPSVIPFVTDPATAPSGPVTPRPALNLGLGFVVGLLLGLALAMLRDALDNHIKDPDALARSADAPLMGTVVEDPKTQRHPIAVRAGRSNMRAENFRQLRANLQFANVDRHPRVIAVTSSIPAEGKTTVAINLASTLAEAGFSVCLVDADLRRPTVAKALGLAGPVGLTNVLINQMDLASALQHAGSNLYVLSSGPTPPNPSEVLASSYIREVVRSLLDTVDYVIIDTAPLLPVADGSEIAALADGTLLVGRYNVTTDANIKRAAGNLRRVDARVIGVVLNRMPVKRNGNEYGYSYSSEATLAEVPQADVGRTGSNDRRRGRTPEAIVPVLNGSSGAAAGSPNGVTPEPVHERL